MNIFSGIEYKVLKDVNLDRKYDGIEYDSRKIKENYIFRFTSFKTLTSTLKELEEDNIIIRKEYPQIPPRVEYSLSKKGETLIPILNMMCDWGEKNNI